MLNSNLQFAAERSEIQTLIVASPSSRVIFGSADAVSVYYLCDNRLWYEKGFNYIA